MEFIDEKELNQYFQKEFILIVSESDRGAILLGLTLLEETLKKNLKRLIPKDFRDDKDSKGKLNSDEFSIDSNLKKSLLLRIIPLNLYKSINKIKEIRNQLAHKIYDFKLNDNIEVIKEAGNLISDNDTLSFKINDLAISLIINNLIEDVKILSEKTELIKFKSYKEIIEYLENNDNLLDERINKSLYKTEFAILIFYLYSLINFHFDMAYKLVGENNTLSSLLIESDK